MKICLAQSKPVRGNFAANIENHLRLIHMARPYQPELIIFPELSISGYEPALSADLATTPSDPRLNIFQTTANDYSMIIGIGLPVSTTGKPQIGMVLFHPHKPVQTYCKQYLHEDELPFFSSGPTTSGILNDHPDIALAICYELTVEAHANAAAKEEANIYITSVAKTTKGTDKAYERLSEIAKAYSMTVFYCNSVGQSDGDTMAGRSACWNSSGQLLASLDGEEEGLLIFESSGGINQEVFVSPRKDG